MKKILCILILTFTFTEAKSCMTDIYFGNGVWNTEDEAIDSRKILRKFMLDQAVTRLDPQKEGTDYVFKYAYNPSHGTREDLIETFWQLKESGQIGEGYFGAVYAALTWEENTKLYNKLSDIIRRYRSDVATMFALYQASSFDQKHNVLLVAHSQGNLFGNKMYTLLNDKQKAKFRMVSVGTPANNVAGNGSYVTLYGDMIIRAIPGSLAANTNGGGHTFVGAYLGKIDARIKIASYVKNAYDDLIQSTSCIECAYVRTMVSEINKMTVECQVFGTYRTEVIGTFYVRKYDADTLPNGNKGCEGSFEFAGFSNLIRTNTDGVYSWETGRFSSKEQLYSRKGKEETYLYLNSSQCIRLSVSGDYYGLVENALAD